MNINDMEMIRLQKENREIKEELAEIHATHKQVIEERVHPDEMHCGCITFYRLEVKRLNKIIEQHELANEESEEDDFKAEMKLWCYKCDSKHDPEEECK